MQFYFLLQVCEITVIFYPIYTCCGTNKVKYCFENSNKMFGVTAISASQSLEEQQKIYFRPKWTFEQATQLCHQKIKQNIMWSKNYW